MSIGQRLYALTMRRGADRLRSARPDGPLVWIDASCDADVDCVGILADRLSGDHGIQILITGTASAHCSDEMPADHPDDIAQFLAHWRPDVIILTGGAMRPALIAAAGGRIILANATPPQLPAGMAGWIPGLLGNAVRSLSVILAVDEGAARAYRKLGAQNVARLGRMEAGNKALPYHEAERAELAALFATRPAWLAVQVPQNEEAAVIAAHRSAMRLAHRLLLILIPEDPARAPHLAEQLELTEGWLIARRELNEEPGPEVSVYIVENLDELGLWYRLAPVTFMGGSLFGAGSARSPLEAAALGSAIIHGRKTGAFGAEFGRLGAALGAAPATTSGEFADLLSELLAPDRAARLAHAAWSVASEGAEVTDRVIAKTLHLLRADG